MYENNPNTEIVYQMNRQIFRQDKRKDLISGAVKDIKKITYEDLVKCYDTFYHPSNMFIVITGNFNPEEALAIIHENQKNKEFDVAPNPQIKKIVEPKNVVETAFIKEMNVETNKVNIGIKIPLKPLLNTKIPYLRLRCYMDLICRVKFGSSSPLHERLVNGGIILNGMSVKKTFTDDYIVINIITETDYPDRFIEIIKEELNHIRITKEEQVRKVKTFISSFILHFDSIEAVNYDISSDIIEFNEPINNLMDIYNEMNYLELNKLINVLKLNTISTLIIKPLNK